MQLTLIWHCVLTEPLTAVGPQGILSVSPHSITRIILCNRHLFWCWWLVQRLPSSATLILNAPVAFVVQAFTAGYNTPKDNLHLLEHLIGARHEMAQLMGAHSFAHYTLNSTTLAGSPEAVESFLQELLLAIQPKVLQHRHQQLFRMIAFLHGVLHHALQVAM